MPARVLLRVAVLIAAMAAMVWLSIPTEADAIENPDFESGDLSGWLSAGDVGVIKYTDTTPIDFGSGYSSPFPDTSLGLTFHGYVATKATTTVSTATMATDLGTSVGAISTALTGSSTDIFAGHSYIYQSWEHLEGTPDTIAWEYRYWYELSGTATDTDTVDDVYFWFMVVIVDGGTGGAAGTIIFDFELTDEDAGSSTVGTAAYGEFDDLDGLGDPASPKYGRSGGIADSFTWPGAAHDGTYFVVWGVSERAAGHKAGTIYDEFTPVPEPSSLMLVSALGLVGVIHRRRQTRITSSTAA